MAISKRPKLYHDKPLFGLDIGHGSLKVMQLDIPLDKPLPKNNLPKLIGYGFIDFDKEAQKDGVILKPEVIAKAAQDLFKNHLVGDITSHRAALAIPAYRTFSRALKLPKLSPQELKEAVELEAEQYIPTPLAELYLDYEVMKATDNSTDVFMVGVPRSIVDSYLDLTNILGLEAVLIESTLGASARLFSHDSQSDVATFIIDFGSLSCDISIYDGHTLVTGTVPGGGENFTQAIADSLKVSPREAQIIKTRYGLSVSREQAKIKAALEPTLEQVVKEIKRIIRYYEDRYGTDRPIKQIVMLGGGANMPGLSEYFTASLRLAVRRIEPWGYINAKGLQPPSAADKPMYATVAGLSLAAPKEIFIS